MSVKLVFERHTEVMLEEQNKGHKAVGELINAVRAESCVYHSLRLQNVSSQWRGWLS